MDVKVGNSKIEGKGVFATRSFDRGKAIGEFEGEIMPESETYGEKVYCFAIDEENVLVGHEHPLKYINHSCDPNCEAWQEGIRVFIHAIDKIATGEELTINYGFDPDWEAPCRCGARRCQGIIGATA